MQPPVPGSHKARFSLGNDNDHDDSEDENDSQINHGPPKIIINDASPRPDIPDSARPSTTLDSKQTTTNSKPLSEKVRDPHNEKASETEDPIQAAQTYPPGQANEGSAKQANPADSSPDAGVSAAKAKTWRDKLPPVPATFAWVVPRLNWKGFRPVLRASISAWCGLILMMGTKSEAWLGQASFLVLVVATINPANAPIATALELTFFQVALVAAAWGWVCLGLLIAHAARTDFVGYTAANYLTLSGIAAPYAAQGLSGTALTTAVQEAIFHGYFLEARSSAVSAVFLGVGAGFLLWLRGHLIPGPPLFGIIASRVRYLRNIIRARLTRVLTLQFAVIMLTIAFTTATFFPYPYYGIGLIFFKPFICQQAINLSCTFLIFPETLAHQFADRLIATLHPLHDIIRTQKDMLATDPRSEDWLKFKKLRTSATAALGGVALLGMTEANLSREITFAKVPGRDLIKILGAMRVVVQRSAGFTSFYSIVETHLHRDQSEAKGGTAANDLVIHLDRSRPTSPDHSRPASVRRADSEHDTDDDDDAHVAHRESRLPGSPLAPTPDGSRTPVRRRLSDDGGLATASRNSSSASLTVGGTSEDQDKRGGSIGFGELPTAKKRKERSRSRHRGHHHKSSSHVSLSHLLHDVLHPNIDTRRVGVVESQRYADLEDMLGNERDAAHLVEIIGLLSESTTPLIDVLDTAVGHLLTAVHRFKQQDSLWYYFKPQKEADYQADVRATKVLRNEIAAALALYRDDKRLDVVRPFASLFDPTIGKEFDKMQAPSHRGIFWAFSYQFSIMGWADALLVAFDEVARVEDKRTRPRFWFPNWAKWRFGKNTAEASFQDENPDAVPLYGHEGTMFRAPRDPDAVPPKTLIQLIGVKISNATSRASNKDILFGIKAALVITLCAMPTWFRSSAWFFYHERGLWVLIMAALTLTQYVGDTAFGFTVRVFGTFIGAVAGLLIWTIAAGTGIANPYALAAVCAVAFPVLMFVRSYYQPPVAAILPIVTTMLILGYSYQDSHQPALSSVGWGWEVAWRRFVCVLLGITIAFVACLIPPRTTQKSAVRQTYAKTVGYTGDLVCQILSFASCKGDVKISRPPQSVIKTIQGLRVRIGKTAAGTAMTKFELSLKGPWPAHHYAALRGLLLEILDLLGQFTAVLTSLDQRWTYALLRRTQFANPQFTAQFLNCFHLLSNALATSQPVPYLFDPLLERYLKSPEVLRAGHGYGFDLEVDGVPQHVDLATLCSLDYLRYSCGVSQVYGITNRLDRCMLVVKELVGEAYIVYGLENLNRARQGGLMPVGTREQEREEKEGLLRKEWEEPETRRNSEDSLA